MDAIDYKQVLLDLSTNIGLKLFKTVAIIIICAILLFVLKKARTKFSKPDAESAKERRQETLHILFYSLMKYAIYFLGFLMVMDIYGIPPSSLLTFAGIGSIAIGFGAQSLIQDCITGVFILMEGQYGVGDLITIDAFTGTVEAIGIRTTRVRSFDGNVHIIPNSGIKAVTNMTKGYKRALVNLKMSYEYPVNKLLEILQDEMDKMPVDPEILYQTPSVVGVIDMDEHNLTVRIAAQCKVGENWAIEREIRRRVATRLQEENITKPYPYYNLIIHPQPGNEADAAGPPPEQNL